MFSESENSLQKAFCALDKIINGYNLNMSTENTKLIAFCGKLLIRGKIVLNNCIIERVKVLNYL